MGKLSLLVLNLSSTLSQTFCSKRSVLPFVSPWAQLNVLMGFTISIEPNVIYLGLFVLFINSTRHVIIGPQEVNRSGSIEMAVAMVRHV